MTKKGSINSNNNEHDEQLKRQRYSINLHMKRIYALLCQQEVETVL